MKAIYLIGILLTALMSSSCRKETGSDHSPCQQQVLVSAEAYKTAPSDQLTINSLKIEKDCLLINFGSSGCNGSTWELKLIDAGLIMESYPPRRNVRLSLKNDELCDAYFTKEVAFDIRPLRVEGDKVILIITNSNEEIVYEY